MIKYTNTALDIDDKVFLENTKNSLKEQGYNNISISKLIKYSVKEAKKIKEPYIIKGLKEHNII
jgi:hypothetical protein